MLTKRRVIAWLCVLVLLAGCVGVYEFLHAPFEAKAELMVRPRSDLDSLFGGQGSGAVDEDQADIAQNMVPLIRSRPVIIAALSKESIKNHPLIQKHVVDPEGFVLRRLVVEVKQPGLIVVRMRDRHDPGFCAELANAIVHAFVNRVMEAERQQKLGTINRLDKHLATQTELEKKKRSELEALRNVLGPPDRDAWAEIEFAKVQVEQLKLAAGRSYEKLVGLCLLDAEVGGKTNRLRLPRPVPLDLELGGQTHGEVVRLFTSTTDWSVMGSITSSDRKVESSWDEENRLATFRRYEEEYQSNMADLGHVLGQIAAARHALPEKSSGSFELDTRQHEIDLLREQVDELVRMRRRAVLTLESGARVEVISPAVKPVSRRHWFGWGGDAE